MIHHAFIYRDVRIAGHPEQAGFLHGAFIENITCKVSNQFLRKGKTCGTIRILDKKNPLKLTADRDNTVIYAVRLIVEHGGEVDFLVPQKRERMTLIHNLRAKNGENLLLEIGFPVVFLLLCQMRKIDFPVSVCFQSVEKMLVVFVALCLEFCHTRRNGGNLFGGRHMCNDIEFIVFQ